MSDPMLPIGTNYCLCRGCGQYFGSVNAFDKHRSGPATARFCLETAELDGKGWRKDKKGYWRTPGGARKWPKKADSSGGEPRITDDH